MQSKSLLGLLLLLLTLVACGPYGATPVPKDSLESAVLINATVVPAKLEVTRESITGFQVTFRGTFNITAPSISLQNPPLGVTLVGGVTGESSGTATNLLGNLRIDTTASLGAQTLTLVASAGGVTRVGTLALTISEAPANSGFKLIPAVSSIEFARGESRTVRVFVSRIKGFVEGINLSLSINGTGLTGVTASGPGVAAGKTSGDLTISANAVAAPFGLPVQTTINGAATKGSVAPQQVPFSITIKTPSGERDPTFAGDGFLNVAGVEQIALQSNDKMITAKRVGSSLIVERRNLDGSQDLTFGTNGVASLSPATVTLANSPVQELVIDNDDKIILLAQTSNQSITLFRLNANGLADASFGTSGQLTHSLPNFSVTALAVQANHSILVVATKFNSFNKQSRLLRFASDGSGLDSDFAFLGLLDLANLELENMVVQADGKIVLVGQFFADTTDGAGDTFAFRDAAIVRVLPSGSLDTSFNGDGILSVDFTSSTEERFNTVTLDNSNRIVATGNRVGTTFIMARVFTATGRLDNSFDGDGKLIGGIGIPTRKTEAMFIQKDNKFVISIITNTDQPTNEFDFVVRLNSNGSLDPSFSGDGQAPFELTLNTEGFLIEIQRDSKERIYVLCSQGIARIAP
jgi:uncharacterized delta-60 repeat protein